MKELEENSTNRAKQENIEKDKRGKEKRLAKKGRKGRQQGVELIRRMQEGIRSKQAVQEDERARKPDSRQNDARSQSQELRDLANSQKKFETVIKIKSHDDIKNREIIEDYNYLKSKVDALDKVERSMTDCKDKSLLKKHQARKNGIERDIGREYGIYRDKPKLFQTKAETERRDREYRERISKKIEQLKEFKQQAEKSLEENKTTRKDIDFEAHRREAKERTQEHIKAQEHEQSSRSR